MVQTVQDVEKRKIVASKEYALQKKQAEFFRYAQRNRYIVPVDFHKFMASYEAVLDALIQLLRLEGATPSQIGSCIQDVADRTRSCGWPGQACGQSPLFDGITPLLHFLDRKIGCTPPSSVDTQSMARAGALP